MNDLELLRKIKNGERLNSKDLNSNSESNLYGLENIDKSVFEEYLKALNKVLPEGVELITSQNIKMAIINYISAGYKVPIEWIELYNRQAKDRSEVTK